MDCTHNWAVASNVEYNVVVQNVTDGESVKKYLQI
jgi:hypothetical protein